MKFKFKLESYLNIKEKLEEQRKLEYGKALARLEKENSKKNEIENQKIETLKIFKESMQGSINPQTYSDTANYTQALKNKLMIQEKEIKKAEIEVEKARKILTESVKERKTLQKLKENEQLQHNKQQILLEQKQVDEIVSYKYNKRD